MGDRLWTNQTSFWKFRQHSYEGIDVAYQLYKIRLPSSLPIDDLSVENNNNFSVFTSTYTVTETCPNNCNSHCSPNSKQESLDSLLLPIYLAKDAAAQRHSQFEDCINASHNHGTCKICLRKMESEIQQFLGVLVLPMKEVNHFYEFTIDTGTNTTW